MSDRNKIEQAIRALEAQRAVLGDEVVDTATRELREKLASLDAAPVPTERRQLVTVLFADVSGFTALSERLDPEEVQALLGRLWRRLDRVILDARGHIDKHIGDAVMAVWGLDTALQSDAVDAVRAALAMQRELAIFREGERVDLGMRVGINTGLSSVAVVESTRERNVIGDTVNLASRLEHAAAVGDVLIGPTTIEHVKERIELEWVPPLKLKGKAEPVAAAIARRERTHSLTVKNPKSELGTPTLGRDAELATVLREYELARAGSARWLTVIGDPGTGKSRLLSEAVRALRRTRDEVDMVRLETSPETERAPFQLLRAFLLARAGTAETASGPVAVDATLRMFVEALGEELGREANAFVGHVLGFDTAANPTFDQITQDVGQIRGRAQVLFCAFVQQSCARRPLVLVVEDLNWADRESLAFFAELLSGGGRARLFVLASARSTLRDREHQLAGRPGHVELPLSGLDADSSRALARALLGRVSALPPVLVDFVAERGAGNPFFIEEVVRWLIARGVVRTDTEPWSVTADTPPEGSLPPRVELVLYERIGRLSPPARTVLEAASVVGNTFWTGAIDALLDSPAEDDAWAELRESGLVDEEAVSRFSSDRQFQFTHALLREVTYEYALMKHRRVYHRRTAEWFARSDRTPSERVAANIAWHFERGEDLRSALEWYSVAGEHALGADAPDAALDAFRRALQLCSGLDVDPARLVGIHAGLGEALKSKGRHGEAVEAFRAMQSAANIAGDPRAQARAENGRAWAESQAGRYAECIESALRAEAVARSILELGGDETSTEVREARVELANALHNRGFAHALLGEADSAIGLGERALEVARSLGAEREMALASNLIGVAHYYVLGDYDAGARHQERALALYRRIEDRWGIACQLTNLGETARARGDARAAVALGSEALAITREIGNRTLELLCLGNLGAAQVEAGDHAAAGVTLSQVIELARESPDVPFFLSETHRYLAEARAASGDFAAALAAGLEALELGRRAGRADFQGAAWRALGLSLGKRGGSIEVDGRACDAETCFERSVASLEDSAIARELQATYRVWASFERERGRTARAAELERLADSTEELRPPPVRNTLV